MEAVVICGNKRGFDTQDATDQKCSSLRVEIYLSTREINGGEHDIVKPWTDVANISAERKGELDSIYELPLITRL